MCSIDCRKFVHETEGVDHGGNILYSSNGEGRILFLLSSYYDPPHYRSNMAPPFPRSYSFSRFVYTARQANFPELGTSNCCYHLNLKLLIKKIFHYIFTSFGDHTVVGVSWCSSSLLCCCRPCCCCNYFCCWCCSSLLPPLLLLLAFLLLLVFPTFMASLLFLVFLLSLPFLLLLLFLLILLFLLFLLLLAYLQLLGVPAVVGVPNVAWCSCCCWLPLASLLLLKYCIFC